MRLGDFFIELGIKPNKKNVQAIQETIDKLKDLRANVQDEINLERELAKAEKKKKKAKIKKKYALDKEIKTLEKSNQAQKANIANFKGMVRGALGVVGAISAVVFAVDRMVNSLGRANQRLMNFQHQTGISLSSLNKYASANVMANPLATIEGTASSLQAVAQNLWDIQLGRGDVSAFQELSYFSGTNVTPYGKSLEEVIESVRSALRNIPNDIQATNLIQRMGFSPDDLQMLRMSKKEFEEIQSLFLNPQQRKELEGYTKELNKIHLQIKLMYDNLVLKLFPVFLSFANKAMPFIDHAFEVVQNTFTTLSKYPQIINGIGIAIVALFTKAHPILSLLTTVALILEDIIYYLAGGDSLIGRILGGVDEAKKASKETLKKDENVRKDIGKFSFNNLMYTGLKTFGAFAENMGAMVGAPELGEQTGAISREILQNIRVNTQKYSSNNTTNNNDNKNIAFNISTNSLYGLGNMYTAVTGQNLINSGAR